MKQDCSRTWFIMSLEVTPLCFLDSKFCCIRSHVCLNRTNTHDHLFYPESASESTSKSKMKKY